MCVSLSSLSANSFTLSLLSLFLSPASSVRGCRGQRYLERTPRRPSAELSLDPRAEPVDAGALGGQLGRCGRRERVDLVRVRVKD